MNNDVDNADILRVLNVLNKHRLMLQLNLKKVRDTLEDRAVVHDLSKYSEEELLGFAKINSVARKYPYGSKEYKESMKHSTCVATHYSKNSHHPEYADHLDSEGNPTKMGWLDIIEMVCDWKAANQTYGTTPWEDSVAINRNRFQKKFTKEQWWLIEQVIDFVS
ncbi:MAG: hypothetical protein KDH96_02660 [Candidatus Riesia sp.]|nr:hypothetical protein [Candidatus Riesia sp.]